VLLRGPTENPRGSVSNTLIERAAQNPIRSEMPARRRRA